MVTSHFLMFACALVIRWHRAFVGGCQYGEAGAQMEHCLLSDLSEANIQKARCLRDIALWHPSLLLCL